MADRDQQLSAFVEMTQSNPETARALLEASNWNLEQALNLHYSGGGNEEDEGADNTRDESSNQDEAAPEQSAQLPGSGRTLGGPSVGSSSGGDTGSGSAGQARRGGGPMTLGQLNKSDPKKQNMYAGGEKSGLAVQNPNRDDDDDDDDEADDGSGQNLIQKILQRAEAGSKSRMENPEDDDDDEPAKPRFSGTGHTLGSDDVPSQVIEDPNASQPEKLGKVTRKLTFWKDGFSVEDGPLMRYDDPQHQETLRAIQSGKAPMHLMNVQPGQRTDLQVYRKMEENYTPPPKKFVPFTGSGQRLGAPTPGGGSSSSASTSQPSSSAPSSSAPARTMEIDSSAATTNLQIRLGGGTRLVSRFNHTHTIGDVYAFVNASNTESRTRPYVLQTTFPNKELKEMESSLKDAGLLNAVIVQKWT